MSDEPYGRDASPRPLGAPPPRGTSDLAQRILIGVPAAGLALLFVILGGAPLTAFLALFGLISLHELYAMYPQAHPSRLAGFLVLVGLMVAADIGGLEIARLQARQFLENNAVDEHAVAAVELVLEEAITNTLRYGYIGTGLRQIEIDLQVDLDEVQVLIVDDAKAFDPMEVDAQLLPDSLDDAQVGGLGLLLIRNTASRMSYERREGKNRFALTIGRS